VEISEAVGDKDELIRYWGQRSRSLRDKMWSCKHFERHFSLVLGMHGHILMRPITVTHYQVQATLVAFSRYGFKGHGHRQYFPKLHFFGRLIPIDCSLSRPCSWFSKFMMMMLMMMCRLLLHCCYLNCRVSALYLQYSRRSSSTLSTLY